MNKERLIVIGGNAAKRIDVLATALHAGFAVQEITRRWNTTRV